MYGQSYGGILAFEYLKSVATGGDDDGSAPVCLSAILSSAPTNVTEVESEFVRLIQEIASSAEESKTEAELAELFRKTHRCRLPEMPRVLEDAYARAGSVWRGTSAISGYAASPPPAGAARMPPAVMMRGEHDLAGESSVAGWRDAFDAGGGSRGTRRFRDAPTTARRRTGRSQAGGDRGFVLRRGMIKSNW